jgi:hypothetical protein
VVVARDRLANSLHATLMRAIPVGDAGRPVFARRTISAAAIDVGFLAVQGAVAARNLAVPTVCAVPVRDRRAVHFVGMLRRRIARARGR